MFLILQHTSWHHSKLFVYVNGLLQNITVTDAICVCMCVYFFFSIWGVFLVCKSVRLDGLCHMVSTVYECYDSGFLP